MRDGPDVCRGGAAASAHQRGPAGDEAAGCLREVAGVARVPHLAPQAPGYPCVGLDADRQGGACGEFRDDIGQDGRPDRAVRADRGDVERGERGRRHAWLLAAQRPAVVAEGELGDHGQVALGERDRRGLCEGFGVAEGLQDDEIHPAGQDRHLLAQDRFAVLMRDPRCGGAHHGPDTARDQRG